MRLGDQIKSVIIVDKIHQNETNSGLRAPRPQRPALTSPAIPSVFGVWARAVVDEAGNIVEATGGEPTGANLL